MQNLRKYKTLDKNKRNQQNSKKRHNEKQISNGLTINKTKKPLGKQKRPNENNYSRVLDTNKAKQTYIKTTENNYLRAWPSIQQRKAQGNKKTIIWGSWTAGWLCSLAGLAD